MKPPTRTLLLSVASSAVVLAGFDRTYGAYATRHFGPNTILASAESRGDACVLTIGDSRMAAGVDVPTMAKTLEHRHAFHCVAPLGIGALPLSGQAMALRRFVDDGKHPSEIVVGASVGTLLDQGSPDPGAFAGNRAAELAWSRPADVFTYYPDFPFGHLDKGVRFLFNRSNSISVYASPLWFKAQSLQNRLVGISVDEPRNRFGSLADMHALLGAFADESKAALTRDQTHWHLSSWFEVIRESAERVGARLVVVEVPMPSVYRDEVADSTLGGAYEEWVASALTNAGCGHIDLSNLSSLDDTRFTDGVHLDEEGARLFSEALAGALTGSERN